MKGSEIKVGGIYFAKVSGDRVLVQIKSQSPIGGYSCTNLYTGRHIHARSARRFSPATPEQIERLRKNFK